VKIVEEEDDDDSDLNDVDLSSDEGDNGVEKDSDESGSDISDADLAGLSDDDDDDDDLEDLSGDGEEDDDDDEDKDEDEDKDDSNDDEDEKPSPAKSQTTPAVAKQNKRKRKAEDDTIEPPKKSAALDEKEKQEDIEKKKEESKKTLFLFIKGEASAEDIKALSADILEVRTQKTGFFLVFESEEKAEDNFKALCRKKINDRYLVVDFLGSKSQAFIANDVKKLLLFRHKVQIRGIPDDATLKDLRSKFPSCEGAVITTTGKGKGYNVAYLSFPTEEAAKQAFEDGEDLVIKGNEVVVTYCRPWEKFSAGFGSSNKGGRGGQSPFRGARGGQSPFRGGRGQFRGEHSPFRGGRGQFRGGRGRGGRGRGSSRGFRGRGGE